MKVGKLKELLKNIPDDVEIFIEDMEDFRTDAFEVSTYYDGDEYVDFIMPMYIEQYQLDISYGE